MGGSTLVLLLLGIFSSVNGESPGCKPTGVTVEVTAETGVLTSPGYDSGEKLDNMRCFWVFEGPQDKFIEITITDVNLLENSVCLTEYLDLQYDDSVEPSLKYCGRVKQERIVVPVEKKLRAFFVSGLNDVAGKGFRLEYRLVEEAPSCGEGLFACKRPFKCIASESKCDGQADCDGGEDEASCEFKAVQPSVCGIPKIQPDLDRIVGGQVAVAGSWPWLASVQANYIWPSGHGCGAALLNNLYVLTAAHCVVGRFFRTFRVKFGDYNQYQSDEGEFTRELETYFLHPNYNRFNATDDLAILKLSAPVQYSDTVSPICLPEKGEEVEDHTLFYAAGWGMTEKLVNSDVVMQVDTPKIGWDKCRGMVNKPLPPRTICTGYDQGGKNPCFGDSGGPLMARKDGRWILHGVVSWGPMTCGAVREATVNTKISDSIDWINKVINE